MSDVAFQPVVATNADHHASPHLAHHFDTPQQQYGSAKLGMWVFLGTEILMFGGLFCAYAVYRHNHPEVFAFAHRALDPKLGGINTAVLITSSLTMALAVRCAQLGQKIPLCIFLLLTLLGGAGFMVIKTIEYETKWHHNLFPGRLNVYNADFKGEEKPPHDLTALETPEGHLDNKLAPGKKDTAPASIAAQPLPYVDPLAKTSDEPKIRPSYNAPVGLMPQTAIAGAEHVTYDDLNALDRERVNAFFSVYFMMTGLHGVHVLVGMGLIAWIFVRSARGTFGPEYFTPVDMVGLYWHLVDLIWIFLFPLLYLIH